MSWTTLDLNNLLAGEPLIESEVIALYENPIAIAEGAAGAPRVQGIALGGVYVGSLARQNSDDPIGINDLGNFECIVLSGVIASASFGGEVQISFSTNNGSSFGSWQRVNPITGTSSPGGVFVGDAVIRKGAGNIVSSGGRLFIGSGEPEATNMFVSDTRSLTIPSGANAFRLRTSFSSFSVFFSLSAYLIGGNP